MKKESLITLGLLSSIILAGCGSTGGSTSDLEKIGKAMEAGKAMRCTVEAASEDMPAVNMVYYIDGENIRVESSFKGNKSIAIQKGKDSFVQGGGIMGDCDWIKVTEDESSEEVGTADFDYKKYEADPMYNMICDFGDVDSENFKTDGKTCGTEDMMQGMMQGMNIEGMDLEGLDLEGIDLSQF